MAYRTPEQAREYTRRWRASNPDRFRDQAWRQPERLREYGKAYYAANRERILARAKAQYAADREKYRGKSAAYKRGRVRVRIGGGEQVYVGATRPKELAPLLLALRAARLAIKTGERP